MRRLILRAAASAVVLSSVYACGGGGYSSSSTPAAPSPSAAPPPPAANATTITIMRRNGTQSFSPNPASVGGQTVVFRNADSIVHRVILTDGTIDTGDIAPGATSRPFQMPSGGANYHCSLHPDMVGAVNGAGGTPPPPCEGAYCDGGAYY
jgi:plastocyanin